MHKTDKMRRAREDEGIAFKINEMRFAQKLTRAVSACAAHVGRCACARAAPGRVFYIFFLGKRDPDGEKR